MNSKLYLSDTPKAKDTISGLGFNNEKTHYNTDVMFFKHGTNELIGRYKNKVLIAGSRTLAQKMFDPSTLDSTYFPTYNTDLSLEDPVPSTTRSNEPIVCLFCCGTQGCDASTSAVKTVTYEKRIQPSNDIIPFRYPLTTSDLTAAERVKYFGRKEVTLSGGNRYAYYFKAFEDIQITTDTTAKYKLMQRYVTSQTDVPSTIYTDSDVQSAETLVELNLSITKDDFREWFTANDGISSAKINSLSLLTGWNYENSGYKWYRDVVPFTQLNIANEPLSDLTKGIDIVYHIYF